MIDPKLLGRFSAVCDELKLAGVSVVAVLSKYEPDDTCFASRLSLTANPEARVDANHIVMDSVREIMLEWSKQAHENQTNDLTMNVSW